jgi:uncharacterized protein (TIGR02145 family)
MKTYSTLVKIGLIGLLFSVLISCTKETPKTLPTLTASPVTNITANSATAGGEVTADGGDPVTARGVCWSSTNATPTTADSKTVDSEGLGNFSSSITGLAAGTTYNIRAYATNSVGTAYYSQTAFKTIALAPVLTTTDFSSVTATSFNSGGNITNDGGSPVTVRGVCYGINQNPTIIDNKTSDGSGIGSYISTVVNMVPGTTYYLRAYATNNIGTTYGNQISTKTMAVLPAITTSAVISSTSTTAKSGGNITSDGGGAVTARGVCWSTTASPTTANYKTTDNTGIGSFTSIITGLLPNTTYYLRAYAINSSGTTYGNEVTFTLWMNQPGPQVNDVDGNSYNSVKLGSQIWMKENLKTTKFNDNSTISLVADNNAWSILVTPAYCWYNNDQATNKSVYGALYNWEAVNSGKLCPTGWHMPTDEDWTSLTSYAHDGGQLKETGLSHWLSPNTGATNQTGFSALPGGYRYNNGTYDSIGIRGSWWSSTEAYVTDAWYRSVHYNSISYSRGGYKKAFGLSVRCIKD